MDVKKLKAYELIEKRDVSDINSVAYLMRHKKTDARVLILENDDENKVFDIGFRTPPYDSTGLPHIMEHSVLCGSKKYPAKDPFIELAKGSLNTFLNAMTFPDKTVYPVASCNDKDFKNLLSVYLDAVFYPNIYEREEIFRQEGWHYELEDKDSDIIVNGVVYNEMKGAFSSPDDMLDRHIFDSLFPDTCYGLESGGDPDVIPQLSYEAFLDFHRTYYHPSNSYVYLYGNADMEGLLDFIDREYLSAFDKKEIDSEIKLQAPFGEVKEETFEYSITEGESLEDNTYLSYNTVIETSLDEKLYLAFEIIEYALLSASGAVLKEALLKGGVGRDVLSSFENGIYQPYFSIISKNANETDKQKFLDIIDGVLKDIVKNGFDKKTLLAGINCYEFRYREADYGHYPKGLMYGLQAFDSWLYGGDPIMHIAENDTYAFLREQVNGDYFEKLVEKYLLNSNHASVVIVKPVVSLTAKKDEELAKRLREYKESLSDGEIDELIEKTAHLKKYQEEEDDAETLKTLPLLEISDLKKEAPDFVNREIRSESGLILKHDIFTNGIAYIKVLFNLDKVPDEDIQYVALLKNLLGLLDTKNYTYADLASEINLNSGGISPGASLYVDMDNAPDYKHTFEMKARVLNAKSSFAFDMFSEMLLETKYDDDVRLLELLNMLKSRLQATMMGSGHSFAAMRAMSGISEIGAMTELMGGISFYRFVEDITDNFDSKKSAIKEKLKNCAETIFTKENFILTDLTCEENAGDEIKILADDFINKLPDKHQEVKERHLKFERCNEGFKTSGKVQYVAKGGWYKDSDKNYTGLLKILKVIMGYDYLWTNVRVIGGAYGCFSSFSKFGDAYFVSYRDPNLKGTLDIYDKAADYFENFSADERGMTKYIIGTVADLDAPLTPSAKGSQSLGAYLSHETGEMIQKERDEILNATCEDIRGLAGYLRNVTSDGVICVLGGEEIIKKEEDLFDKTCALIN